MTVATAAVTILSNFNFSAVTLVTILTTLALTVTTAFSVYFILFITFKTLFRYSLDDNNRYRFLEL